jgi:hypothetical protein
VKSLYLLPEEIRKNNLLLRKKSIIKLKLEKRQKVRRKLKKRIRGKNCLNYLTSPKSIKLSTNLFFTANQQKNNTNSEGKR